VSSNLSVALGITLIVEIPIVVLFYPRQRARMAIAALLAATATTVGLNVAFARVAIGYGSTLTVGESIALLGDAIVFAFASRECVEEAGWPRALVASAAANLGSYIAGLIFFAS
jgi:hypothetical protein